MKGCAAPRRCRIGAGQHIDPLAPSMGLVREHAFGNHNAAQEAIEKLHLKLDIAARIDHADSVAFSKAERFGIFGMDHQRRAALALHRAGRLGEAGVEKRAGRRRDKPERVLGIGLLDHGPMVREGRHFLHRLAYLTQDPAAALDPATQQCRAVAALLGELLLPSVRVETNGLGRFLPALLRRELALAGVACTVIEHVSVRAKEDRILAALEPALAARRLYANEGVFRTPFAAEMAEWRPGAAGVRDDALDAVAGCLLAEPVRLVRGIRPLPRPSWRG